MSYLNLPQSESLSNQPINSGKIMNNNEMTHSSPSSVPMTIMRTTGTAVYHVVASSMARKAMFAGAMYFAGGTIASAIGLPALIVTGALIWIL